METSDAVAEARDAAIEQIRQAYVQAVMPARRKREFGIKQVFRIYEEVKRSAQAALAFAEKVLGEGSYILDDKTREAMLETMRAGYERAIEEAERVREASAQMIVDDYERTLAQADEAREQAQAAVQTTWSQYQQARDSALQALARLQKYGK